MSYILRTYFFTGYYHLWYVLAIIYTMVIVCLMSKLPCGLEALNGVSRALLVVGVLCFGYGNMFLRLPIICDTVAKLDFSNNMETQWLTIVVPFFMLGYWLRNRKAPSFLRKNCETLLVVSLVLYFVEVIAIQLFELKNSTTLCIFTYPIIYLLLLFAEKHPGIGSRELACYSSGIAGFVYFSHILVVLILQKMGFRETPVYLLTIFSTVTCGWGIVKVDNRYLNRLIR